MATYSRSFIQNINNRWLRVWKNKCIIKFNEKSTRHRQNTFVCKRSVSSKILISIREKVGMDHFDDSKAFIDYSNDMHDVYTNINEYNISKECKILIVFDIIADVINNKNLNSIVTELFIRGRKSYIKSLIFITKSYFKAPKDVRLKATHFFITKIPNKRELQQIAINHSSDINNNEFINTFRECTAKPYSFLVNNTTLASENSLRFKKILFKHNKNHDS